jgi:hypothetical protein
MSDDHSTTPQGPFADQPKAPPGTSNCAKLPEATPPELPDPPDCPEPDCNCPERPPATSTCFDALIQQQTREITEAERARSFKTDLEALLDKANAARKDYTAAKYQELLDRWKKQDTDIAELLRRLACAVPCWDCVIECHICPLVNEIRALEFRLHGDGTLIGSVHSLYDLQHWHERNRDAAQRQFDRIKGVLAAWETPAGTIEQVLNDNAKMIEDARQFLAPDAVNLLYDVFMRLVPRHLAIAPPSSVQATTIEERYTDICACDTATPDDCCGPDVGMRTLRERLVGPQPYLILPEQYFPVICCLVQNRYLPAKDALAKAEGELEAIEAELTRVIARIESKTASIAADFKADLPVPLDCAAYEKTPNGGAGGHDHDDDVDEAAANAAV